MAKNKGTVVIIGPSEFTPRDRKVPRWRKVPTDPTRMKIVNGKITQRLDE